MGQQTSEAEFPHALSENSLAGPLKPSRDKNKPFNETTSTSFKETTMNKKLIAALIAIVGAGFLAKLVLKNKLEN